MSDLIWIVVLIPFFPLLGFLINTFFIRQERAAGLVASAAVVLSFITVLVTIAVLQSLPADQPRIDWILWDWFTIGDFRIPFGLLFDQLTAVMALLVTGVGALIHIYSLGYIHGDVRPVRFFAYLNLFIFSMLLLIMADNLLLLFLGWEGVGLCSFLLIGHWFDRRSVQPGINPSAAAVKAFVVNRIGDVGLFLAMIAIFATLGTLTFYPLQSNGVTYDLGYLDPQRLSEISFQAVDTRLFGSMTVISIIGFLMLLAVTGKSAQVPLFVWLPDAMAGPTPVSALIHAATMVTSGVYLLARNHTLFAQAANGLPGWIVGLGALTALLAATAAVPQMDIKRVLAYSTISQLGYMVVAAGMGAIGAAIFHLLTHGIFKALLFLSAGSIIHGTHDTQDMRHMGGLRDKMPVTFWTFLIGSLALAGIFPLAGFWSKDEIIGHAWFEARNPGLAIMLIIASLFTAFYVGRQLALVFWGTQRDKSIHAHESPRIMTVPLIILAVGAVLGGLINFPFLHWLSSYLQPVLEEEAAVFDLGHAILAAVTFLLAIGTGYLGWWLYAVLWNRRVQIGKEDPMFRYLGDIWRGGEIGWGLDLFYEWIFVRPYRVVASFLSRDFDQGGIDGAVNGVGRGVTWLSLQLRKSQTGYVRNYALVFLIGVIVLIGYFAFGL